VCSDRSAGQPGRALESAESDPRHTARRLTGSHRSRDSSSRARAPNC
jgi:hypothetical protein